MCNGLEEGSEVKHLVELMKTYQTMLLPHFKHEEDFTLPMLRAYFTPEGEYNRSCPPNCDTALSNLISSPVFSSSKEFAPVMEKIMKNSDDVSSDKNGCAYAWNPQHSHTFSLSTPLQFVFGSFISSVVSSTKRGFRPATI